MERLVETEWLDQLPPEAPEAAGSRRDLRRLNAWMGNARLLAAALRQALGGSPQRIADLGAGDGSLILQVAGNLPRGSRNTRALLVDRQSLFTPELSQRFSQLRWSIEIVKQDALDWLQQPAQEEWDAIIANLFLHHFTDTGLKQLLKAASRITRVFVAVEPRRSFRALMFSRLVRVIGCNDVTQHDAPASVRAGFSGRELSSLWPADGQWMLSEKPAGMFSHVFVARKLG